jgi:hypothetical protein
VGFTLTNSKEKNMDYEAKKNLIKESNEKLKLVVNAGLTLGLWEVVKEHACGESQEVNMVTVKTNGLTFDINGGSWAREGMIKASIATLRGAHGLKVSTRDALAYNESEIEASCSCTQPAEKIAKALYKRVMQNPEAVVCATKIVALLANLTENRAALHAHMSTLQAMGYEFNRVNESDTYMAEGYNSKSKPRNLKVYNDGRVDFEISGSIEVFKSVHAVVNKGV